MSKKYIFKDLCYIHELQKLRENANMNEIYKD